MKGKIFNAQEVQAILAGNKTMFREVIKSKNLIRQFNSKNSVIDFLDDEPPYQGWCGRNGYDGSLMGKLEKAPYQVGQKIFVKEAVDYKEHYSIGNYHHYTAWKKQPASQMNQKESRLTLRITGIKVEKLGEISEEDCWKEGLEEFADYQDNLKVCEMAKKLGSCIEDAKPTFAAWWNATHKKPEEKFEASPWVWCVNFEVINN